MKRVSRGYLAAAIAVAAIAGLAPAWAVNKCVIDGQTVFQDAACPGKGEAITVKPASGASRPAATDPSGTDTAVKPMTEAQRIESKVKQSQDSRRKVDLETRIVPGTENEIARHRAQCDREYQALQAKKSYAKNNLAGATWENSISSEMAALATRCDTRNRDLRDELERLRAECQKLGGCN